MSWLDRFTKKTRVGDATTPGNVTSAGDVTTVGDIENSEGIAIGTGASVTVIKHTYLNTPGQLVSEQPPCPALPYHLAPVDPSQDDRDYLRSVIQHYTDHFIGGMINPLPYVPAQVVYRRPPNQGSPGIQLWDMCSTTQELMKAQRLLVLGRPGIGKSSMLQFLAQMYAQERGTTVLPVAVSLRGWLDQPGEPRTLLEYIVDFLRSPIDRRNYPPGRTLTSNLETYLSVPAQEQRLLFLLDDYDRIPPVDDADYERRVASLRDFADKYWRATIVVVCRSIEYDGKLDGCAPKFKLVEMSPWSPMQIEEYLKQCAPELLPYAKDERILNMADIPYQLVQLVEIVRARRTRLEELFADVNSVQALMEAFIERLFEFSEQAGHGKPEQREQVKRVLGQVAGELHKSNKRGGYIEYSEAQAYIKPGDTGLNLRDVMQTAADATILDITPDWHQLGFERQQLEDYFARWVLSQAPAAYADAPAPVSTSTLQAQLHSGGSMTPLLVGNAMYQQGLL